MYQQTLFYQRLRSGIARHWKLVTLIMLFATVVPMAVLLSLPKKYVANANTQVLKDDLARELGVVPASQSWITPAEQNASKLRDLLSDNSEGGFLDRVLRRANMSAGIDLRAADDERVKAFREGIAVGTLSPEVFSVAVTWANPRECERICKAIQDEYIDEAGASRERKGERTKEFLEDTIGLYEERLKKAEDLLIKYRQQNSGNSPEQEANEVNQLSLLKSQMDELQVRSKDAARKRSAILARMKQINPQSVMEQTLVDDPRAQQVRQLELDREMLLNEYTAESDEVRAVDSKIAALRRVLERSRDGARRIVETKMKDNPEYQDLSEQLTEAEVSQSMQEAQIAQLKKRIQEYHERIKRMPEAQRVLTARTRDYDVLKAQYESLLRQREAVLVKSQLDATAAKADLQPIGFTRSQSTTGKKRLLLFLFASCVLGLVISGVMVVTREWLDTSIYLPEDAERLLELPVLGTVPHMLPSKGS